MLFPVNRMRLSAELRNAGTLEAIRIPFAPSRPASMVDQTQERPADTEYPVYDPDAQNVLLLFIKDALEACQNRGAEHEQKAQMDVQRKLQGINQSYALQMRQKLDVALGEISRNEKLDAVVQNAPDQPVAVSGCIDITDKAIEKLQ